MVIDPHFTFPLSVSQQKFTSKPTKDYQVTQMTFVPQVLSVARVLELATEGHAFCPLFNSSNPDGVISTQDKTLVNFQSASALFVDYDHMDIGVDEFIGPLPYPPTGAYSTYSDGENGLHSFRLIYVFKEPVTSIEAFNNLNNAVAFANGFVKGLHGGWDKLMANQMYYGTTRGAFTYSSEIIYSQEDFRQFVSTPSKTEPTLFDSVVSRSDLDLYIVTTPDDLSNHGSYISPEFLSDFKRLSPNKFLIKYWDEFYPNYILSLSSPLILDESEMFYTFPEKYYIVKRNRKGKNTLRWIDGERRRKRLYVTAQIMRRNVPTLSIENLIYNLAFERQYYYDNSDKVISNDFLIRTANNAFKYNMRLGLSKHGKFQLNKPYWEGKGYTANQAKMKVRKILKAREVIRLYDSELTITENWMKLNNHGVKISKKTLERMRTNGDVKINTMNTPRTYLSCCRDSVLIRILEQIDKDACITQPEIASALNLSSRTVRRYLDKMKEALIVRKGNNRSGRWVILPAARQILQEHLSF